MNALAKMAARPRVLVSASAIGFYGDRGDEMLTEESGPGQDFLSAIAQEWEAEAEKAEALGIRVVRARFGVILAKKGGALPQWRARFALASAGELVPGNNG